MALSTGIPTSFVPRQTTQGPSRPQRAGRNVFLMVALGIAGLVVLLAVAVFGYKLYLTRTLATRTAELSASEGSVDENTVDEFVRLRDRLSSGKELLSNHVMLSQLFDELENTTLKNIRYSTMVVTVAGDHTAKLEIEGTARNFNALAAQSNAFASDKRIKRAIFSKINTTENGLVSFLLTADVDSSLIVAGNAPKAAATDALTLPEQSNATVPAATTPVAAPSTAPRPLTATTTASTSAPTARPGTSTPTI